MTDPERFQTANPYGKIIQGSGWQGVDGATSKALTSSSFLHIAAETCIFSSTIYGIAAYRSPTLCHFACHLHIMLLSAAGMTIEMEAFDFHLFLTWRRWLEIWARFMLTPIGRAVYLLTHCILCLAMLSTNVPLGLSGIFGVTVAIIDIGLHCGYKQELADLGINATVIEAPPGVYSGPGYSPMRPTADAFRSYQDENYYPDSPPPPNPLHTLPDFKLDTDMQDPYNAKFNGANAAKVDAYRARFGEPVY